MTSPHRRLLYRLNVAALAALMFLTFSPPATAAGENGEDELISRAYQLEHLSQVDGIMLAHQACLELRGHDSNCRYEVEENTWFIYNTDAKTQEAIAEVLARHDVPARSLTLRLSVFMADNDEHPLPPLNPGEAQALADLAQLLPYRGYRLVETGWLRAENRGQINLGGMPAYVANFRMKIPVDPEGTSVRMEHFELFHLYTRTSAAGIEQGPDQRAIVRTSFTMEIGETVVVGTSRLDGKDEAMVVLLTASR
jgi:hypothetical protein